MEKINGIEQAAGKYITNKWEKESKDENKNVQESMKNISDKLYGSENSLFLEDDSLWNYEEDCNKTIERSEYENIFSQLSDNFGVDINDSDIATLWNILDTDGNGYLSEEEYAFLTDDNNITGYSLIHALGTRDDNVADYVESNSTEIYKGSISFTSDEEKNALLQTIKDIYGEDSEEYTKVSNASENEKLKIEPKTLGETEITELANTIFYDSTKSLSSYKELLSDESYNALEAEINSLKENAETAEDTENTNVQETTQDNTATSNFVLENYRKQVETQINYDPNDKFETPKDVITSYIDNGVMTAEEAKILQYSYYTFNEEDAESRIANYSQNLNKTREEAIDYLVANGLLTTATDWETPLEKENDE